MKFFVFSLKKNFISMLFVLITFLLVIFSESNLIATKHSLELWAFTVVPSLFPFFVITNLLAQTKVVSFIGKFFDRLMKPLFNVPGIGGFAFVMGLISGYPVGAKIVSDFRNQNLVSKDEGERLLAFTNNSGPLFILSSVGIGLFGNIRIGLLLLFTHILACITVGVLLGKFSKKGNEEFRRIHNIKMNSKNKSDLYSQEIKKHNNDISLKNLGEILSNSINNSISTIFLIGGFVVIFSVIISILNKTNILQLFSNFLKPFLQLFGINTEFAKPLLSGIIELTNGVKLISNIHIKAISQNIILCALLLGFGGFSVLLQVLSIISKTDLSIKKYVLGKSLQGIFACFYTYFAIHFIPSLNLDIVEVSANLNNSLNTGINQISSIFYNFGLFILGLSLVFLIFNIIRKIIPTKQKI